MLLSLPLSVSLFLVGRVGSQTCWETNQRTHQPLLPPPRIVNYLANCLGADEPLQPLLEPLLTTRVPDTEGNSQARDYLTQFLADLGWSLELDSFTQDTVIGEKTFHNIIATRNRNSPRRLVLAAHYDTKITPEGFIGATDSAAPCAMMLHLAKVMDTLLPAPDLVPELTLTFIFFDGEEAFRSWTSTDSLYGSRHLASQWTSDYSVTGGEICQDGAATHLDRIDTFLLLDLLGTSGPSFKRYTEFNTTLYDFAARVEVAVQGLKAGDLVFTGVDTGWMVQDDQVPFYQLGVTRILHLISSPFPSVWHTLQDNEQALHYPTIDYLNKILRVFVYGYLNT